MHSKEFLEKGPQPYGGGIDFAGKDLYEIRAEMDKTALQQLSLPNDVKWEYGQCGGVPGIWIYPENADNHFLLYFHGGGLSTGSALSSLAFVSELARRSNSKAFTVDYRMPPEYPYPAFVDDCCNAYKGLLDTGVNPTKIAFGGESAGGYLVMSTCQRCLLDEVPLPGALVIISGAGTPPEALPPSDSEQELPPFAVPASQMFPPKTTDFTSPVVNPALGDLTGFPPVMLTGGGAEKGFEDESNDFASAMTTGLRFAKAGCDVKILIGQDMSHCYPQDYAAYPEADQAVDEISHFIKVKLSMNQ